MAYFEQTKITDPQGVVANPASEDSNVLLRRIVKLLESQAAVDPNQRQRIIVDGPIAAGTNSIGNIANVATVTTVTTVTTVATVTSVTNVANLFGWNQQILVDPARTSYNTGIRNQLTFS